MPCLASTNDVIIGVVIVVRLRLKDAFQLRVLSFCCPLIPLIIRRHDLEINLVGQLTQCCLNMEIGLTVWEQIVWYTGCAGNFQLIRRPRGSCVPRLYWWSTYEHQMLILNKTLRWSRNCTGEKKIVANMKMCSKTLGTRQICVRD